MTYKVKFTHSDKSHAHITSTKIRECWDDLCWRYNKIEVLGNVHDNPELLGGDDNDNHT